MHSFFVSTPRLKPVLSKVEEKSNDGLNKNLFLIWLGSALRPEHIKRIIEWKKLNSDRTVTILVDPEFEKEIKAQLVETNIIVKSTATLVISEKIKAFIKKFVEPGGAELPANYAAASDIYRFILLNLYGGWYVDTDIEPINLNSIGIKKELNFFINANRNGSKITTLSPSVIASTSNHLLTQVALELIERMSMDFTDEHIKLIRNSLASVRMLATHLSTGFVLRGALGRLYFDLLPFIQVHGDRDKTIDDTELFDSATKLFLNYYEQSWLLDRVQKESDGLRIFPIKGVTLDKAFLDCVNQVVTAPDFSPVELISRSITLLYPKIRPRAMQYEPVTLESLDQRQSVRRCA